MRHSRGLLLKEQVPLFFPIRYRKGEVGNFRFLLSNFNLRYFYRKAPITETLPSVKSPALIAQNERDGSLGNENNKDELVDRVFEINLKDKL